MIPPSTAASQLLRRQDLEGFRFVGRDLQGALVGTLAEVSPDPSFAARLVDRCLAEWSRCPSPAELRRIGRDMLAESTSEYQAPACDRCADSGWRPRYRCAGLEISRERYWELRMARTPELAVDAVRWRHDGRSREGRSWDN